MWEISADIKQWNVAGMQKSTVTHEMLCGMKSAFNGDAVEVIATAESVCSLPLSAPTHWGCGQGVWLLPPTHTHSHRHTHVFFCFEHSLGGNEEVL